MKINDIVKYVGGTWLAIDGAVGVITEVLADEGADSVYMVDFNIPDGEDWMIDEDEIKPIESPELSKLIEVAVAIEKALIKQIGGRKHPANATLRDFNNALAAYQMTLK